MRGVQQKINRDFHSVYYFFSKILQNIPVFFYSRFAFGSVRTVAPLNLSSVIAVILSPQGLVRVGRVRPPVTLFRT